MASDAVAGIPPDDALAFEDVREVRASGVNVRTGEYLNVNGDAAIRTGDGLSGAHSDIAHP